MGKLPVRQRGVVLAVLHADHGDGRRSGSRRQYRRRGTAVGVRVSAAAIRPGWVLRMIVTLGDRAHVVRVIMQRPLIHLLVG